MKEVEIVLEKEKNSEIEIELTSEGKVLYPSLEDLEVTPSNEEQVFTHEGSYGYDKVTVKPSDSVELEASYLSLLDNSLGANVTKLPSGLTQLRGYAFYNCSELELNEIPEEITNIPAYAFFGCSKLALTKLPDNLSSIGNYAFYGCTNLNIKTIPKGITTIRQSTFNSCSSLTELTFLGQAISFSTSSFGSCSNLEKLVFPNITRVVSISSNTLTNTPIARGTGYVYVPDSLVDSFKSYNSWKDYANQIKPLSEL